MPLFMDDIAGGVSVDDVRKAKRKLKKVIGDSEEDHIWIEEDCYFSDRQGESRRDKLTSSKW